MGVERGQRRTSAFSQPNPLGCKPTRFAVGMMGKEAGGGVLTSPPPRLPVSMRQDRPSICSRWKITLHFQKGNQSVNLSQTHICSSAARKVVKALISELGGRDNDTSAAPQAQRKKTSILGLHQRPPRFLPPWL